MASPPSVRSGSARALGRGLAPARPKDRAAFAFAGLSTIQHGVPVATPPGQPYPLRPAPYGSGAQQLWSFPTSFRCLDRRCCNSTRSIPVSALSEGGIGQVSRQLFLPMNGPSRADALSEDCSNKGQRTGHQNAQRVLAVRQPTGKPVLS